MELSGIDADGLARWLDAVGIAAPLVGAERLSGGSQNIMLRLDLADGRRLVLRHPPAARRQDSNRSIAREMELVRALSNTDVPHARYVAGCPESPHLAGATAYLTEYVDGFHPGIDGGPDACSDTVWRHRAVLDVPIQLARFGSLVPADIGLPHFGRPDGFLARQVARTARTWDAVRGHGRVADEVTVDVPALCQWLDSTAPPTQRNGLVHGDFHLDNILFDRHRPAVAAIVDFEMAGAGDPLLDLGWLLTTWPSRDGADGFACAAALRQRGPLPQRRAAIEQYATATGCDLGRLDWYVCLAAAKLGVLLHTTYVRSLSGQASRDTGTLLFGAGTALLEYAQRLRDGAAGIE